MSARLDAALAELVDALREEVSAAVVEGPDQLLSIEAAARRLGVGRTKVYEEIAAGRLRTISIGRRRVVPSSAIVEFSNR